jgi:hypothetical protein
MENRCKSCKANACCRKCVRFVQSVVSDYGHCGWHGPVVPACGGGGPCPRFSPGTQPVEASAHHFDFVVIGEDSRRD